MYLNFIAVVLSLVFLGFSFFTYLRGKRVPKGIENIKEFSVFSLLLNLMKGLGFIQSIDKNMEDHIKYRIFRTYFNGRWQLMNSDPDLFKRILYETESFDKLTPNEFAPGSLISNMFGINIVQSAQADWKKHRRIVNPAFKKGWNLSTFSECVEEVFERLGDGDAINVDVDDLIQRVTVEALGRELMGFKFDAILTEKKHKFISYFNDLMYTSLNPIYFILPFLDRRSNPFRYYAYKKLEFVNQFFNQILEDRKKSIMQNKNFEFNDVLSMLLNSGLKDSNGLTDEEIRCNTLMFFLAGQDTTTFTICATLHLLAENPEIQERARKEVLNVLGNEEYINGKFQTPTIEQLNRLEYVYAIMQESMRLYPAVSVVTHRIAQKDIHYKEHVIPKGTLVDTCIYAIHRNPDFFKDPNTFNPSRYLNGGLDTTKFESNWFTFSSGSRICLGAGFSLTQQKIILSNIIRRYRITPITQPDPFKLLKIKKPFLLKVDDLRLNFERISIN